MRVISCIAITALSGFLTLAFAAPPADSGLGKGRAIASELGLNAQQKEQLKTLREEMRVARKDNMDKMKVLRDKSREELLRSTPDKNALYALAKDMGELHKAMAEKEADHMLKVKAVLTPDQFKKLLSRDFWRGKGHGGPHDEAGPGPDHGK